METGVNQTIHVRAMLVFVKSMRNTDTAVLVLVVEVLPIHILVKTNVVMVLGLRPQPQILTSVFLLDVVIR